MFTYRITENDHCRRVENLLYNLLPAAPHGYLKQLAKTGSLQVNGTPPTLDLLLRLDDTVTLKESSRTRQFLTGARPGLDIIYEDQWLMIINKEPGLPMHRAAEVDEQNLVDLGMKLVAERGGEGKLRPINRLDRGTSGVVMLAKSSASAAMFGQMLQEEGLDKLYLAVVAGKPVPTGSISAALEGKEAETRFRVLFQGKGFAFVAVWPVTGRMHQIRQHFKIIGHPIRGDKRYGGGTLPDYPGHLLHSFRTTFIHPSTGTRLTLHAPLPSGFISQLRLMAGDMLPPLLRELPDL
ncbi:MAG: RluA family pseudouridine synthase [Geobacter sp.]|nr:MAG: RluA family pseudouridine synthase [Geobacter sp.]